MLPGFIEEFKNFLAGVGFLKSTAKLLHKTGLNGDPGKVKQAYAFYLQAGSPLGKTILEIGPGQTWQIAALAASDGAKSVIQCDIEQYFPGSVLKDLPATFRFYDGSNIPAPSCSIDLIWSHNVYEHVRAPMDLIEETFRVLRPGGRFAHSIDLRDHFFDLDTLQAFNFLKYSKKQWERMTLNRSVYANRVRSSEWVKMHEEAGFTVQFQKNFHHEKAEIAFSKGGLSYLGGINSFDRFIHRLQIVGVKPS